MPDDSTESLVQQLEIEAQHAGGPDIYVIRALKPLIKSNQKVVEASERVKVSVEQFEKSTNKTEQIMIALTAAQLILAGVTLFCRQ